ncbi:MAG: hypothetical protein D6698_13540 [Gammaproteobacteria bacterium]|nr:MAG: hypothetical protein D6698_13540 [Gammaproteobacteria bacterium]
MKKRHSGEQIVAKLRQADIELLNRELFLSLDEARYVLDEWWNEYNHHRLHGGIGWQTPAAYAAMCDDKTAGVFPTALMGADPPVGATPLPTALHPSINNPLLLH